MTSSFFTFINKLIPFNENEMKRDIWFQEEARAERLSNLLRVLYTFCWLLVTVPSFAFQPSSANIANIGLGCLWMAGAILFHFYLSKNPYQSYLKYVSTTFDILITTGILFVYHFDMGFATSLKSIPFLNYLFVLILAALRFHYALPVYGGVLSVLIYSCLIFYAHKFGNIEPGSMMEEFTTSKVNFIQQLYRIFYLSSLSGLLLVFVGNIHRLVRIRVEESEKAIKEKAEKDKSQSLLERYFSTDMAYYLTQNLQELGGNIQRVTVMVCDLRGFTTLSEKMGAVQSVSFLNKLFEQLVSIVFKYDGTLDKFLGDGMLVVFGVPHARPDDAIRAVRASRELVKKAREIGCEYHLDMGIALNTGDVIFGNIGSQKRMEFTIIGDTVNTASRIEALNKEFHTNIIITESTYREVNNVVKVRKLPIKQLRGKSEITTLYEVEDVLW
jgi:class 3 adenylate cyclase